MNKKTSDIIFEEQCAHMRKRALKKKSWGRVMTITLDQETHKRFAIYAADFGLSATSFVPHVVTDWVNRMDRKGLTK